jgi:hypothetical protein
MLIKRLAKRVFDWNGPDNENVSYCALHTSGLKRVCFNFRSLYRVGHEKVARVRSQQHAIEDDQRLGGGGDADSTTID